MLHTIDLIQSSLGLPYLLYKFSSTSTPHFYLLSFTDILSFCFSLPGFTQTQKTQHLLEEIHSLSENIWFLLKSVPAEVVRRRKRSISGVQEVKYSFLTKQASTSSRSLVQIFLYKLQEADTTCYFMNISLHHLIILCFHIPLCCFLLPPPPPPPLLSGRFKPSSSPSAHLRQPRRLLTLTLNMKSLPNCREEEIEVTAWRIKEGEKFNNKYTEVTKTVQHWG